MFKATQYTKQILNKKRNRAFKRYFLTSFKSLFGGFSGGGFVSILAGFRSINEFKKYFLLKSKTDNSNRPQIDVKIIPVSNPPKYMKVSICDVNSDQIKIERIPSAKTIASDTTKNGKNCPVSFVFFETYLYPIGTDKKMIKQ